MEKRRTLPMNIEVAFTDEPERAACLAASGLTVITLAGKGIKADAYVSCEEDFDELSDEYINRIYMRNNGQNYHVAEADDLVLRECDGSDYFFFMRLLQNNKEALVGYDESLWTDDIIAEEQFEKTIKSYYELCDFGAWILEKAGKPCGIFGISAEDEGAELYYVLEPEYRGLGIALRICRMILEYAGDELGMEELYINCNEKNKPSRRLAERLGFSMLSSEGEGTVRLLKFIKKL